MTLVVALFGLLIVAVGLTGIVAPRQFRAVFGTFDSRGRFVAAIVVRLAMGALLWWLADDLRHPQVMRVLAAIAVVAAVVILLMGRARLDRLVNWWLGRPDGVLRLWAGFAALFGAYLVYVAL